MNIDSIKNYPALSPLGLGKPKYGLENKSQNGSVDNTGKNVNRGYYGSFTGKEKAAVSFSHRILDKIIDACNDHTTIVQNLVALVLAVGFRPLAILSLPGKKNKEDKIYASGHSMASGLIGFAFSSIVMYPLGEAAKKIKEHDAKLIQERIAALKDVDLAKEKVTKEALLKDTKILGEKFLDIFGKFNDKKELTKLYKKVNFDAVYKGMNMAPDVFVFGVIKAMLTIALIPPILKHVFGIEKSKPGANNNAAQQVQNNAQDDKKAQALGGQK